MSANRRRRNVTMAAAPTSTPGSLRPSRVRNGIRRQPWGTHTPGAIRKKEAR